MNMEIPKDRPVTISEIGVLKSVAQPSAVMEAFNTLLVRNWNGRSATIDQDDVVILIMELDPEITRERIDAEHMLDIEPAYHSVGYAVSYDKPGFNEPGTASFEFSRRK